MTRHHPDLGSSASDWSRHVGNSIQLIRSTAQIWVVTHHQYGISALVSQTSFGRKTNGSVAKCRLFSQATLRRMWIFSVQNHVHQNPGNLNSEGKQQAVVNINELPTITELTTNEQIIYFFVHTILIIILYTQMHLLLPGSIINYNSTFTHLFYTKLYPAKTSVTLIFICFQISYLTSFNYF